MDDRHLLAMPEVVRRRAQLAGAEGEAWLAALPALLGEIEAVWSLRAVETLPGGTAAFVARVVLAAGGEAALKVCVPGTPFEGQVAALRLAGGRGYAGLLAADPARRAMLLELVGPPLTASAPSPSAALRALARTLRVAWCRQLAADGGCDEQAVWDWGYLERVSTGLVVLSLGATEAAATFLESAALLTP